MATLPATYGNGKEFVAGSAKSVRDADGAFAVVVTLADGTDFRVYDKLNSEKRATVRVNDLNTIEE